MRFLLLSGGGDGLGLALRLKMEGHEVGVWIREGRSKSNYDGLLVKVKRWEEFLKPDTVVFFDSSGGGRTADRLRARGFPVFAGSSFADQLELDRSAALEIMQEAGIKIPHSETFRNWEKAREYVKKEDKRLVFKPSGETAEQVGSYVSYDPGDMVEMLELFEETTRGRPEFELQDFIEGHEISSEGWFDGNSFKEPWNHTIERKQLMNDGLGPSGGCAGNVVWIQKQLDPVIRDGIGRMAGILAHHEYIGPIDLNTVVNDEGVWGLEFTPRFGYDAIPAFLELLDAPFGETIAAMAHGSHSGPIPVKDRIGAGLRITIPPYPTEKFHSDAGIPIRGLTKEDRPHLYFYDVMLNERNRLVSSNAYGAIVTATGIGDSITEALEGPIEIAKRARIPNKQYRTDLPSLFVRLRAELDPYLKEKEEVANAVT